MPKKRKSTESDNDEQANDSTKSLPQNEDNAKRAKLDLPTDTMLQDLPVELLQLILVESVVMEVKGLKLAKSVWKEKADPIANRLRLVCSQWNDVLTTDHFTAELHRTLDDTDPDPIRLEVLEELSLKTGIRALTILNDEIFTLRKVRDQYFAIDVYDRDDMDVVTDVIKLPKSHVKCMAAGKASNCLYVGLLADQLPYTNLSVLRIRRDAKDKFVQSSWEHKYGRSVFMLSVSATGHLLTFTLGGRSNPASVAVHKADDSLELEVFLARQIDFGDFRHMNLMQRPNGNLVLSFIEDRHRRPNIVEMDTNGNIVRQYESTSLGPFSRVNIADDHGRIIMTDCYESHQMELLDSEFNLLGVFAMKQDDCKSYCIYDLKYDGERSVVMRSHYDWNYKRNVLTTFRFTDDLAT